MTIFQTRSDVFDRVRAELAPASSAMQASERALSVVDQYFELQPNRQGANEELALVSEVEAELMGFGFMQPYLNDSQIEEIWINRPGELRYAKGGQTEVVRLGFDAQQLENLVFRLLRNSSRRVDRVHPFADATLVDGSRVHVVIPPITGGNWTLNVRKFPTRTRSLDDLVDAGMLTIVQHAELTDAMVRGCNLIVSGSTQAGKTTFLSALLGQLPNQTRVISIEETHELRIPAMDWVAMQGRPEAVGGSEVIDLRRLLRESLRMRPDFLVVGEVRGAEALELLLAMNTGIPCTGTIHAKNARAAVSKLKLLPALAQANIDQRFLEQTVDEVLDGVIHIERVGGVRRVSEIYWLGRA
jgi:pilus assembly protein CpaF